MVLCHQPTVMSSQQPSSTNNELYGMVKWQMSWCPINHFLCPTRHTHIEKLWPSHRRGNRGICNCDLITVNNLIYYVLIICRLNKGRKTRWKYKDQFIRKYLNYTGICVRGLETLLYICSFKLKNPQQIVHNYILNEYRKKRWIGFLIKWKEN